MRLTLNVGLDEDLLYVTGLDADAERVHDLSKFLAGYNAVAVFVKLSKLNIEVWKAGNTHVQRKQRGITASVILKQDQEIISRCGYFIRSSPEMVPSSKLQLHHVSLPLRSESSIGSACDGGWEASRAT